MTLETDQYIGAIPKNIFYDEGEYPITSANGYYTCNVGINYVVLRFPDNNHLLAWVERKFLFLDVVNKGFKGNPDERNPDIHIQRLIIEAIVPAFLYHNATINGVKCSWEGWGTNYDQYRRAKSSGKSKVASSRTTWTYNKIAVPLGFTGVQRVTEKANHHVEAVFVAPKK